MSAANQTPNADAPRGSVRDAFIISVLCVFLAAYAGNNPDTASEALVWMLASGLWFGLCLGRARP